MEVVRIASVLILWFASLLSACGGSKPQDLPIPKSTAIGVASNAMSFDPVARVLPELGYGYEPTLVGDRYGNLFSTAAKELWQQAVAPDVDAPTLTRSMSWARMSSDGGKTWKELPGLTAASLERFQLGLEGDMAFDGANHLYYVDTYYLDSTITRWTVSGLDQIAFDFTQPLIPALQPQDDRPWITAHGDGHVFYVANQPGRRYTLGEGRGTGFGPGRYTLYASYDGGRTFNPRGYTLNDSGACRPAADPAPGSTYVYVFCSNDAGKLYSYVSEDDGRSFERYFVADYVNEGSSENWPTLVVSPDGSLYALRPDGVIPSDEGKLMLYRSSDRGRTWTAQNITPEQGPYQFAWLAVAPDGRLGMSVCHRRNSSEPWHIYGAIWTAGEIPTLIAADLDHPVAPANVPVVRGDYTGSYFDPEGRLNIVWNRPEDSPPSPAAGTVPLINEVWFSRTH